MTENVKFDMDRRLIELTEEIDRLGKRNAELEGALSDAEEHTRRLSAWRDRAFAAMRDLGLQTREIIARIGDGSGRGGAK